MTSIGRVRAIVRYPVKSMAGVAVSSARLGHHGIAGDRRFALRRLDDRGGRPWLTANRFPALLTYRPVGAAELAREPLPTRVRTPSGSELDLRGEELLEEIARRSGCAVEMMMLAHGIFDDAPVSLITTATVEAIGREAGFEVDPRRMRANVVVDLDGPDPFAEDGWLGATLVFGDGPEAPAVSVTKRDERCAMINLDPDTAARDGRVLQAVVRLNANRAGVYATVVRAGSLVVGQPIRLARNLA